MIASVMVEGCSYRLYKNTSNNLLYNSSIDGIETVLLSSYDPCHPIVSAIKTELYKKKINVFNDVNNDFFPRNSYIFYLHIVNVLERYITTSVFKNGEEAEYQLMLDVKINILIPPNKDWECIKVHLCRSLIGDPRSALSKSVQNNNIITEMYQDAAKKIIYKLFFYKKSLCILE
ncbi:LPS assembly lipoprotein LptE [Candidatus Blochmannia ocreatus (nom. nud.)]|uniref:Uncharacterized protein n=1 Tax=Candidatus Blochmannia ocreatus (nom. nud.) TaxID=251538 RepID=A0ABY4SVK3_9ENTR|nr:LPS assembly lipoprotein LptE [Candidatus Blochmannia ocreatus]URJ25372.1 hypothetical protein M9405_01460 [Candidatus Blochmannia ocreatus]